MSQADSLRGKEVSWKAASWGRVGLQELATGKEVSPTKASIPSGKSSLCSSLRQWVKCFASSQVCVKL